MVALVSPQPVFRPSQRDARRRPAGSRHLRAVPALGDVALPDLHLPDLHLPELHFPELALPEFELGRKLALAVPALRPALLRLDNLVDLIRWGGTAGLRFALVAVALLVAVVSVRLSQGLPPADVSNQGASSSASVSTVATGSSGDVVLSFSSTG